MQFEENRFCGIFLNLLWSAENDNFLHIFLLQYSKFNCILRWPMVDFLKTLQINKSWWVFFKLHMVKKERGLLLNFLRQKTLKPKNRPLNQIGHGFPIVELFIYWGKKKYLIMCQFMTLSAIIIIITSAKVWKYLLMENKYIVVMVLGSVFIGYVVTSLILFRFPLILHRKKKLCFRPVHISHRGGNNLMFLFPVLHANNSII